MPLLLPGGQQQRGIHQLAVAGDGEDGAAARLTALDEREELVGSAHPLAVDGHDQVGLAAIDPPLFVRERTAALLLADDAKPAQARALGRAARNQSDYYQAVFGL